ncbi:alpha/beta fold hydrolase [Paenibacillus sp. ISL-20]|uniref:alpha/beta fold hydrolase n=1 Tax=Paenibacillus sp. ISL-20 TaxID=2819163 RepID=UPI001BE8EBD4|nr:alpha/beta fold hydrolase [Paenibacillus sp. ISL-20]MBT2765462.1 serine hydrolase family protein [Paenibacillus sp. ISL-20]
MKRQVLFIHSAGPQGIHQGSSDLIAHLQDQLGKAYHVLSPGMPDPDYALWKAQIANEINALNGEVLLVGHSLGGSVLLKYLSEEDCQLTISGLFLIAAPYWGKDDDWQNEDFRLPDSFATTLPRISSLYLYHSRHDPVVPFAHAQHYAKQLPQAITRVYEGDDHYFREGLPELVDDIKRI